MLAPTRNGKVLKEVIENVTGKDPTRTAARAGSMRQFLVNVMMTRANMARAMSNDPNKKRDLDRTCGWIQGEPTIWEYQNLIDREGLADRINGVYPEESWSVYPTVTQNENRGPTGTAFDRAWDDFEDEHDPFGYLARADRESGIGYCGIMLIGFDDGRTLDQPVEGIKLDRDERDDSSSASADDNQVSRKVLFLRPMAQTMFRVKEMETNPMSPRYGLPTMYQIIAFDPTQSLGLIIQTEDHPIGEYHDVHWHRIHHLAENLRSSNVYAPPRLKNVVNRVHDVRKILGGSGEMFWLGARPAYSLENIPGWEDADFDMDSAKDEVEAFMNDLQPFMRLQGLHAHSLAPKIGDPTNHLKAQYEFICSTIGVPYRIFFGSEQGFQAGEQDAKSWHRRLGARNSKYLSKKVVRTLIRRLQNARCLPNTKTFIDKWTDLNVLSMSERADVTLKKAQALLQYVTSGAELVFPIREFFTMVFDMTDDEAEAVIKKIGEDKRPITKDLWDPMAGQTPNSTSTNPTSKTNAGGRRNALGGK